MTDMMNRENGQRAIRRKPLLNRRYVGERGKRRIPERRSQKRGKDKSARVEKEKEDGEFTTTRSKQGMGGNRGPNRSGKKGVSVKGGNA